MILISPENFDITETYILLHVSVILTVNIGVFSCFHCIRIQILCSSVHLAILVCLQNTCVSTVLDSVWVVEGQSEQEQCKNHYW